MVSENINEKLEGKLAGTITRNELKERIEKALAAQHGPVIAQAMSIGDVLGGIFGPSNQQQQPTVVIHNDQSQNQGGYGQQPTGGYNDHSSAIVRGMSYRASVSDPRGGQQDINITFY